MSPADEHRDPDIDAAWRATSREQPPPALDAAITAAARRAVGAGPKSLHAPRAWWPVAAAAVIAVVAIGIVDMTPPDEVAPTAIAPAPPQSRAQPDDAMRDERARASAVPERPPSELDQATRQTERASPPVRADAPGAATEAKRKSAKPGNPFPAPPSEPRRAANAVAAPVEHPTAAPAAPQAPQEVAPSASGATATQAPASPVQDATAPAGAAGALGARRESASSNASSPLAKRAQESATAQDDAQPRTVDEWVRLIRRLKAEGRNDLVAKELAAFRARYQDRADALLPPDLREARP